MPPVLPQRSVRKVQRWHGTHVRMPRQVLRKVYVNIQGQSQTGGIRGTSRPCNRRTERHTTTHCYRRRSATTTRRTRRQGNTKRHPRRSCQQQFRPAGSARSARARTHSRQRANRGTGRNPQRPRTRGESSPPRPAYPRRVQPTRT